MIIEYDYPKKFDIGIFNPFGNIDLDKIKDKFGLLYLGANYSADSYESWKTYWLSMGGVALIVNNDGQNITLKVLEEDKESAIVKISSAKSKLESIIGKLKEL